MTALQATTTRCCVVSWITLVSIDFISATEFYKTGTDEILKRCVERYDDLMKIMLKTLREERQNLFDLLADPPRNRSRFVRAYEILMQKITQSHSMTKTAKNGPSCHWRQCKAAVEARLWRSLGRIGR